MWRYVLILMVVFCTGCKADMTDKAQQKVHFVKADLEVGDKTPEERALTIKARLQQIDKVEGTAVVVEGHTAVIGLRLQEGLRQNQINSVKKEADVAAKHANVDINNTSITTNNYIVSMIEEMERNRAG